MKTLNRGATRDAGQADLRIVSMPVPPRTMASMPAQRAHSADSVSLTRSFYPSFRVESARAIKSHPLKHLGSFMSRAAGRPVRRPTPGSPQLSRFSELGNEM
jgi:hypothetical protein